MELIFKEQTKAINVGGWDPQAWLLSGKRLGSWDLAVCAVIRKKVGGCSLEENLGEMTLCAPEGGKE